MKHIITAPSCAQQKFNGRELTEFFWSISVVNTGKNERSKYYCQTVGKLFNPLRHHSSKQHFKCPQDYIPFHIFMKSEEGEFKETCHLREGMSSFWKFEYQRWQLSSVTNITGLTTSIANLASSKLYRLKMEISNTSGGIHEKDTFLFLYIKIIVINLHAVSRYKKYRNSLN